MAWYLLHLQQVAETQRVAGAAEAAGMFGEREMRVLRFMSWGILHGYMGK